MGMRNEIQDTITNKPADKNWMFCRNVLLDDITWGKVVGDDVGGDVPGQNHLEARDGEVAERAQVEVLVLWLEWEDV